jgi:hypothetical protein
VKNATERSRSSTARFGKIMRWLVAIVPPSGLPVRR